VRGPGEALGRPLRTPEDTVPLIDKIKRFLASPQGRRLTDQGRRWASDPRNQQKLKNMMNKRQRGH
jgi:hypothetical protein